MWNNGSRSSRPPGAPVAPDYGVDNFVDWEISFEGKDELDCQNFVAMINRYAYKQGKAKDDEWIAEFAGACFTGNALTWYIGLDEAVQDSWKQLRKAVLTEYVTTLSGRSPVQM